MKYFYLLALCAILNFSLNGQSDREYSNLRDLTYPPITAVISQACSSITSYQEIRSKTEEVAKRILGEDRAAVMAFGRCDDDYYRAAYSPDVAEELIAASRENKRARTMANRWSFVLARAYALKSKSGTLEIYRKYGAKVLKTMQDPKKKEALINREFLLSAMFFNEWVDRPGDMSSFRCGGIRNKFNSETRSLKIRGDRQMEEASAGGSLAPEGIRFSYPANGQANFYPLEYIRNVGLIKFKSYVGGKLNGPAGDRKLWIKWTSSKGQILFTRAILQDGGDEVIYQIPSYFFDSEEIYRMDLVSANKDIFDAFMNFYGKRELATLIEKGVYHLEKKPLKLEEVFFTAYFRVSKYGSRIAKDQGSKFYPSPGEKDTYLMNVKEGFGAEEISGVDGRKGMLKIRITEDRSLDETLGKMYSNATGRYLNHPSQEYVDYLKKYRDSLNVDSLIATEFMPASDRAKKYRRFSYTTAEGKRRSLSRFGPWLPKKPEFRESYVVQANARRVTANHHKEPGSFRAASDTLRIKVNFTERVLEVYNELVPILEARHDEYANILRQLNELASSPVIEGTDYRKIVANINPTYLTNPESLNLVPKPRELGKFVSYSYGLPLNTVSTTNNYIPLVEN